MDDIEAFLRDAASLAGVEPREVLSKVLHVRDDKFATLVAPMDGATRELAVRLDRELRVRNPGLHYVERKMFLGYRREGVSSSPQGERSQIFASVIRRNTRLEVVLPVDTESIVSIANARDVGGKGHHGVGDVSVSLSCNAEIDRFLIDFDHWLRPSAQ